jgi:putative inorganic carbon (hco3(-)) transporter
MSERLTFTHAATLVDSPTRSALAKHDPAASTHSGAASADSRPRREPRDWAFIGLMAFTTVLFFRPQDMLPFLAPLHLAELAALGALTALVFGRLTRGVVITRTPAELLGVAALGGVILVTAPFSIWPGGVIGTFLDMYVKVLLIFVLMVNTLASPRRVEQFTWIIVIALGYLAFRAVLDYGRGVNLIENGRVRGAVGGIFRNPNDLALNLVSVLPLAISLALTPGRAMRRALALLCVMFMLAATVVTQSRGGTVGLALMFVVFAVKLVRKKPGLVFAGVLALIMAVPLLPASYLNRISSIANPSLDDTGSREARRILLREAAAAFVAHPLTGVGAGQFINYNAEGREEAWRESHNVVLQVAAELGVFGLMCFGFLVARAFIAPMQAGRLLRKLRQIEQSPEWRGAPMPERDRAFLDACQLAMSGALAGWFVCALFGSVAYNWTFYYLLGLAIAPREILLDHVKSGFQQSRAGTRLVAVHRGV